MLPALLLFVVSAADPVWMPGAAEKERFKAYFTQGEKLYSQGEYGAAIWNFRRADRQLATPEVIYDLAKCHEKLGDVAFATYYYRLYLKRSPSASDALDVAERVGTALAQAEANGRGFLEVEVPGAEKLKVSNYEFPEGPIAIFLPPGDFEVTGTFPDGPKRVVAQLRTGKTTTLVFEPLSPPLVEARPGAPDEAVRVSKRTGGPSAMRVTSYVVAGLGVAALAVGTVLGVLASGEANQLKTDKTLNYNQAQALANGANDKGLVANVLWGVGGAAVAGGVVMFIVSMPEPGMKSSGGSR
ncbi:MAG: hypothetical protein H6Q89_925 [Myxococcaceae bacterium]|nr:hypothetical protein [Myxococcaceae bacterium]